MLVVEGVVIVVLIISLSWLASKGLDAWRDHRRMRFEMRKQRMLSDHVDDVIYAKAKPVKTTSKS